MPEVNNIGNAASAPQAISIGAAILNAARLRIGRPVTLAPWPAPGFCSFMVAASFRLTD
jgi:hypothetical protein